MSRAEREYQALLAAHRPTPDIGYWAHRPERIDASDPPPLQAWATRVDLRSWQIEALAAWERKGRRGVVEAATGTGKTMVALGAAERLRTEHGVRLRVVVVVPTRPLAHQWVEAFVSQLGVPRNLVGEQHSSARHEFSSASHVLVTVINTARERLNRLIDDWERSGRRVLLVVDECHRTGTDLNVRAITSQASYTLGLSATPERSDRGHETHVYAAIGAPVYRYGLLKALDDRTLAPLRSVNLYVDLDDRERATFESLGRDVGASLRSLERSQPGITLDPDRMWARISRLAQNGNPQAMRAVSLTSQRRDVINGSTARARCVSAVLRWLAEERPRAIVFHESISAAEHLAAEATELGIRVALDHSKRRDADRRQDLDRFRRNLALLLFAVRSLDEGIDVPDASVAVIAAGSRSRRQRIQRLGRVLRPLPGKRATAITVLVRATPEEAGVGGRDAELLGADRAVHHRWPGRPVHEALGSRSSYSPAAPPVTASDQLTAAALGLAVFSAPVGGYSTTYDEFSINAWHRLADVHDRCGMPAAAFDAIFDQLGYVYRSRLDGPHRDDWSMVHGTEIEAIRRTWAARM